MTNEERDAIPLREYVDLIVKHEKELRQEWTKMNQQMVTEAKEFVNDKLQKMNEVREQILAERGLYVTKLAYDAKHESLETRVRVLENAGSNLQGRVAVIVGVIGIAVVMIAHFWK